MEKIFFGGNIYTMKNENDKVEAVLVKDGQIIYAGKLNKAKELSSPEAKLISLNGKTMLPSFIDPHSHISHFASGLSKVQLAGTKSLEELAQRLREYISTHDIKEGDWVIGIGYDHNNYPNAEYPTAKILDEVSAEIPIAVSHASGHMGAVNSKLLSMFKINNDTKNPEGGVYVRDNKGNISGYMEETAFINIVKQAPAISIEEHLKLMKHAESIYASYGITTAQDILGTKESIEFYLNCKLDLDVVAYLDVRNSDLMSEYAEYTADYKEKFRIGGYKLFLDGSPQGKTAWMSKPYEGEKSYSGYPIFNDEQVKEYVNMALSQNKQLLVHCNGDNAAEQFISAYDKHNDMRNVMIHAQFLRVDQIDRMKAAGIMPSYFVAHTYFWGDTHIKNTGDRAYKISPLCSSLKRGVIFTLHQDTPVLPPDMLKTIWCAVNRITSAGVKLGEEECVSVYEAIKAVTFNSAYQYFEEDKKGSIEVGKLANFVVLSENPFEIDTILIDKIKVLATYKDGNLIYKQS